MLGHARALWLLSRVDGIGFLPLPLADRGWRLGWYVAGGLVTSFCIVVLGVLQTSFRQVLCPDHLLGRMNATMRFLFWGTIPRGSLAGGSAATWLGLRPTVWIAGGGIVLATLWLAWPPLRTIRDLPAPVAAPPRRPPPRRPPSPRHPGPPSPARRRVPGEESDPLAG